MDNFASINNRTPRAVLEHLVENFETPIKTISDLSKALQSSTEQNARLQILLQLNDNASILLANIHSVMGYLIEYKEDSVSPGIYDLYRAVLETSIYTLRLPIHMLEQFSNLCQQNLLSQDYQEEIETKLPDLIIQIEAEYQFIKENWEWWLESKETDNDIDLEQMNQEFLLRLARAKFVVALFLNNQHDPKLYSQSRNLLEQAMAFGPIPEELACFVERLKAGLKFVGYGD